MKSYDRARAKVGKGERIGGLEGDLSEDEMFMYSYCVVSKMYNIYIYIHIYIYTYTVKCILFEMSLRWCWFHNHIIIFRVLVVTSIHQRGSLEAVAVRG